MNTYNTTQVQSDEPEGMSAVRQVFERASNAIVEASKLSKEVAALRSEVDAMKHDIEYVRARNRELDEQLAMTRQQRDEARQEVERLKSELSSVQSNATHLQYSLDEANRRIEALSGDLQNTKQDRDRAYDEWHKADTAKSAAEEKLRDIEDFATKAFSLVRPTQSATTVDGGPSSEPQQASSEHANPTPPFVQAGYGG